MHKVYHQALNKTASRVYRPIQQLESAVLLQDLLEHVEDGVEFDLHGDENEHDIPDGHWYSHVRRMVGINLSTINVYHL